MIKKIMSVILTVVMSLSLCTVAFAVDVSENNYEIFMLPVISDKLPTENQVTEIKVYLDKQTDTAFVALEDVCELIGASCSQEDDIYAVQRDAVYFSYNGQGNMELYLLTENSTSVFLDAVAQATGNIIRKNIIGHRLLDGDLFESRKISNQWYVDYIKFCDMFGVKLSKYTSNNHNNLLAIMQELNISLSHDVKFNFDKNPYYVKMYSGTTLSSIYQKVMRNYETYLFDYYALKTKNSDFWDDVTQKLGTMFQLADLQYKNVLSNVINDWNGFTSALIDQYEPGEHYTESLVNILNSNYLEYVIKNSNPNNELLTFSDFVEYVSSFYYYIWDKAPTWTANALSAHENTENYIEFFNTLTETNNDYKKVLESMSGIDDSASGFSIAKIILNSMIAFKEVHNTCNQINNLSSDKMNFLQKGIFENEKLVAESSKVNISGVIDKISQTANILYPAGVLNMSSNYVRKALQNSDNNAKGVIDSAKKIYNTYGNVGEQNLEKLKEVLKTAIYTELDEGTQQVLSKFPETVPIAVAMSVIDGSMALAKSAIGEELKDAENLVQYYYIEQNLLCNLNEWNPEKLHINLTFALMASLCCYENQKKVMESVFQELESQEIDLPKYYFESMEEKRKELDDSINKIAEALYQLDHQKTQLCIDYYHDPRNNNVSAEIVEAILHYNNGTISGRVLTDNNQPIEKAKISVFVFANGIGIGSEEDVYYTDSDGKFSIPVSARNEYMLQVTCDGNEFVQIYPVVVERQEDTYVGDIYMKVPDNTGSEETINGFWRDVIFIGNTTAAVSQNGDLYVWGYGEYGQIGNGSTINKLIPTKILSNVKSISGSIASLAAITNSDDLYMWGSNLSGEAGTGTSDNQLKQYKPVKILSDVKSISLKNYTSAAITKNGDLYMWGRNGSGQIGNRNTNDQLVPVKVLSNVKEVSLGSATSAAILNNGDLYMWGNNDYGQIIDVSWRYQWEPIKVLSNVKSVSSDRGSVAVITENNDLYLWGNNRYGQLGDNTVINKSTPVKILSDVETISLEGWTSAAITKNGDLYMWGRNGSGQVGNRNTNDQLVPVKVLSNVKKVSLGSATSAAILNNGDLYMWGNNDYGQIGNGNNNTQLEPIKVLNNVKSISLVGMNSSAITNDGELYIWGNNKFGQIGNGTTKKQLTPYKVTVE